MERLTLDEAIKHAKGAAKKQRWNSKYVKVSLMNGELNKRHESDCIKDAEEYEQLAEWLEELKSYKDLEEQGLLVRLPCKVGDDVYIIPSPSVYGLNIINGYENLNRVYHQHIRSITFADSCWYAISREEYDIYSEKVLNDIAYGITWFTDREEAEKKLEELHNDKT